MKGMIILTYQANVTIVVRAKLIDAEIAVKKFCAAIKEYDEFETKEILKERKGP
jgi:hypothetical protein